MPRKHIFQNALIKLITVIFFHLPWAWNEKFDFSIIFPVIHVLLYQNMLMLFHIFAEREVIAFLLCFSSCLLADMIQNYFERSFKVDMFYLNSVLADWCGFSFQIQLHTYNHVLQIIVLSWFYMTWLKVKRRWQYYSSAPLSLNKHIYW